MTMPCAKCPRPIRAGELVALVVLGRYGGEAEDGSGLLTACSYVPAHLGCPGPLAPAAVKEARHAMRVVAAERPAAKEPT